MKQDAGKSLILLVLAVVAIGGGLVYWQWGNRADAQQRLASLQSKMPDEQQLQNDLTESQTKLEESRFRLEHLEKALPTVAYVPTLLKELELVGRESNLIVTGVRPVPAQRTDGDAEVKPYEELEIDITGQGNYRAVMTLVSSLQGFPKVLAVRTVSLTPRQDPNAKPGELDATVRLKAYMFKPDEEKSEDEATEGDTKQALLDPGTRRPAL